MRRGQRNRWLYEAFPRGCQDCKSALATSTVCREGQAKHLCTNCFLRFKRKEREAV